MKKEEIKNFLKNAYKADRIGNFYLIHGGTEEERKEIGDFLKIAGVNQIIPILETFDDVKEHFQG